MEFEYDTKNLLYVRIDRKRKFLASVFLRALGLRGADEIIRSFYTVDKLYLKSGTIYWGVSDSLVGLRAAKDIVVPGENFTVQSGKKITQERRRGAEEARTSRRSRSRTPSSKAPSPPPTSSIRRPAK